MSMSHLMFFLLILSIFGCGKAPEMPSYESAIQTAQVPLLDPQDQKIFFLLPLQGKVKDKTKFWSGNYWPFNRGNINVRWNTPTQFGFNLDSPNVLEASLMTTEQLMGLSPTEKFDLLLGRYDYPLKEEVATRANPGAAAWEGICNGWAPATLNHNEPTPKEFTNPDGITVPFGSSDIKALLSYYYAYIHKIETNQQMGRHCAGGRWQNWNQDCESNLNPGSFHIALTNNVGIRNKSFLVDIDRYEEVWNHPIVGYYSQNLGDIPLTGKESLGTARKLKIRTRIIYVDEATQNTWDPIMETPLQKTVNREYAYELHLDANNTIIGGEWLSNDRPDFLWMMGPTKNFLGLMEGLEKLLDD